MNFSTNLRFWNVILAITIIICVLVLGLHYKNWVKVASSQIRISSGFYSQTIKYTELDSVIFVKKIPPMERLHGFSALDKEKGIFREFKDSLTEKNVYVFVDNINQQKLKLVYQDSLYVYFNWKDSVQTIALKDAIITKMNPIKAPN